MCLFGRPITFFLYKNVHIELKWLINSHRTNRSAESDINNFLSDSTYVLSKFLNSELLKECALI